MTTPIKLYRGDSSYIERFEVNKTSKNCLYGRGVYLTNDVGIASTYLTKGLPSHVTVPTYTKDDRYVLLSQSSFPTLKPDQQMSRPMTYAAAFASYVRVLSQYAHDEARLFHAMKAMDFIKNEYRPRFAEEIQCWIISKLEYRSYDAKELQPIVGAMNMYLDDIREQQVKAMSTGSLMRRYDCIMDARLIERVGAISSFVFDRIELDTRTVNIDIYNEHWCRDERFWRKVYEKKLPFGDWVAGVDERTFVEINIVRSGRFNLGGMNYSLVKLAQAASKHGKWQSLRNAIAPLGFLGFRHTGGINTNGRHHRVYILWDDDYIADHRLE